MQSSSNLDPKTREEIPQEHLQLLPVLPMLYIAWANNVLTPTELRQIRSKIATMDWIGDKEERLLEKWLDPKNPPSPAEVQSWLATIRKVASQESDTKKRSLAELGMKIANIGGTDDQRCASTESCQALYEVEKALGVVGQDAQREIFPLRPHLRKSYEASSKSNFDIEAMSEFLYGDYVEINKKVRSLLRDPSFAPPAPDLTTHELRQKVKNWCREIARQGWGALFFPENYGGKSDLAKFIAMIEVLAFHNLNLIVKVGVQFGLFGGSLYFLGTKHHHDKYLRNVGDMKCMGCFAMTEDGHGSNVRELETVAWYDRENDEFVIHTPCDSAHKEYIGNAAEDAHIAVVFAQLHIGEEKHGVHAFVVPVRNEDGQLYEGVRIEDCGEKLGLNGVDNGRIWFDNVRIARENLLDRYAQVNDKGEYSSPIPSASQRFFTMLGTLVAGRISIAAAALSAAKSGLTIAIRYATSRHQFGPSGESEIPILNYPSHQKRLFPLLAKAYALDFATKYLIKRYSNRTEEDSREVEALAAGIKAYSTWNTTYTLQTCRECCGGKGYLAINRIADLKGDSDAFSTLEGDNMVLLQLVAKALLGELRQELHEMNWWSMTKYIVNQATASIFEYNPITTRLTDQDHLRSIDFQLETLQSREQYLLRSVARRLKKRLEEGMDSYHAFLECQNQLVLMATAYVERLVLEQFSAAVEKCSDQDIQSTLKSLCDLYALDCIARDRAWFLENGYFETNKSQAIMRQVSLLCSEIKPQAIHLVNAFAIPDRCLAAPIAVD